MKGLTLKQLEYFVCLADELNFRRAASILGVSQPSLSAQISSLEASLQISLFERSRTGTFLSPQGKLCLDSARAAVTAAKVFAETAEAAVRGPSMTYRIGVPPTLGPYLLPYLLPRLHDKWPSLKLYVREAVTTELEKELIDGKFDLILLPLPILSAELSVEPLFTEPLKFVVPIDHELANKKEIVPEDISEQPVLTLEEHHHFHYQVQQICEQFGARILRDFEGTSLDTLRQMVVMGLGAAFLPGLYVHSELHRPEALKVFEFAQAPIRREHALVWRNTAANRVFFRALAREIRSIMRKELGHVVLISERM
jgi:LysR family hydrogen peroxide-inducible transcriptional activator